MLNPEILCSPVEAYKLRRKITTALELNYAMRVMEYYNCPIDNSAYTWNLVCMIADVFNAGRISGIRQERKRRKHN